MQTAKNSFGCITIALFISVTFALTLSVNAQKPQGIFKSANDFNAHTLTFVSTATHNFKIHVNNFFKSKTLKIITKDTTYTFCKDSIYGYQDKSGAQYRFFANTAYPIIYQDSSLILYKLSVASPSKYHTTYEVYYFSKNSNSKIMPLTQNNIKMVYQTNQIFLALLEYYFNNNVGLMSDDFNQKISSLSQLLELSKIKNN